jgi:hypothetical protein
MTRVHDMWNILINIYKDNNQVQRENEGFLLGVQRETNTLPRWNRSIKHIKIKTSDNIN